MGSTRATVGPAGAGLRAQESKHPPADGTRMGTDEGPVPGAACAYAGRDRQPVTSI